jgi:hypothetical protein
MGVGRSGGRHDEGREGDRRGAHVDAREAVAGKAKLAAAGTGEAARSVGTCGIGVAVVGAAGALVDVLRMGGRVGGWGEA